MTNLGNKEIFAKNLRNYIEKSGKTQIEIAELAGVAQSTFNDWVRAKKYPRIDKIEILANIFKILKSDLIEERSEERKEMQKNNEIIADLVVKMRTDDEFLSVVDSVSKLDSEKLKVVQTMISALLK